MTTGQSQAANEAKLATISCDFNASGVRIHTEKSTESTTLEEGNPGDGVALHSIEAGEFVNASCGSTDVWDNITDNHTGVTGWVLDCFTTCE
ncbi:MAG: hypothetical protein ACRDQX_04825 [Pseudonocardiaceae bacterium]